MVGVPRSRAIADWPTGRLALVKVKVEVLIEVVTSRVEFGVVSLGSTELAASTTTVLLLLLLLLFLRVVTAAPFKLLIRAEAVLRGVVMRFLVGLLASVDGSPAAAPRATLEPRMNVVVVVLVLVLLVVLMLAAGRDAKVDTPDAVSVVMDAPCD